ncbi:hypothetical protein TRFO_21657 [Tritrichomonas foetus]|uniref:P/Homo B domain-containing protein n=1 Tax=Tritrichomonas foetus TaxID=1144522 RepID=A0A1J4KDB4_9EUKA|nr:hypothetical protein TRFO_21657 [Tritrichomonas foetus]|eukprot:OHT09425.1 hypothetical protein TRFO_21657 [Tritrichomonas foetus]
MLFFVFSALIRSFNPADPLFPKQYHIKNDGTYFGGLPGEDLNIVGAWDQGATGENVKIIIINDGCQANHSELVDRFDYNLSYNYETETCDPSYDPQQTFTYSGIKLATLAAGENNDICGIGIAYKSTIGCVNVLAGSKAQKNYNVGIKRDNDLNLSIRVFPSYTTCSNAYCEISDYSKNDEKFFQNVQAIFVTSFQGAHQLNDDLAYSLYPGNPYILTFAEISQRGSRITSTARGNTILASVVTGGPDYDSTTGILSAYLSTGDGYDDTCSQTVLPMGTSGAMAAGVISLILSVNNNLKRNDITSIIALTSVKNDPNSKSWHYNKAGVRYSDVYGFGRIDADAAVSLAKQYYHREYAKEEAAKYEGKLPIEIPSFLSGFVEVPLNISKSNINYIDFVELIIDFSGNLSDYSLFRIFIESPSGTNRLVKDISMLKEVGVGRYYRIAARDFFGEQAEGIWKVKLLRENVGPKRYRLESISLTVTGYENADFPSQSQKAGENPFQPYERYNNVTLTTTLENNKITCNSLFMFTVEASPEFSKIPYDLILAPEDGNGEFERFGVGMANSPQPAAVYCHYKPGNYILRAINPIYHVSTQDIHVELINPTEEPGFGPENQYKVYEYTLNQIYQIPINLKNLRSSFSPYKREYFVLATLWNYETNKIYGTQLTMSINGAYVYNSSEYCPKCILTVVPYETDEITECNTFINAISLVEPGQKPEKFEISWNNVCPLPTGIIIPQPQPTSPLFTSTFTPLFTLTNPFTATPDNKQALPTYLIAIIVLSTVVVVGIIVGIIFWQVKKKILWDKNEHGMSTLLLTQD